MVYRVLKDNFAIKNESEIESKLLCDICCDEIFDNMNKKGEHNIEL